MPLQVNKRILYIVSNCSDYALFTESCGSERVEGRGEERGEKMEVRTKAERKQLTVRAMAVCKINFRKDMNSKSTKFGMLLLLIYIAYLAVGAAIFMVLETPNEVGCKQMVLTFFILSDQRDIAQIGAKHEIGEKIFLGKMQAILPQALNLYFLIIIYIM